MSISFQRNCTHVHGIIPHKLNQKVVNYHERKGHQELFDHCTRHLANVPPTLDYWKEIQAKATATHLERHSILPDGEVIKVYDCKNTDQLQRGKPRRDGKFPAFDHSVNEAYNGAVATYEFLKDVFKIRSIDNHNFPLISNVHYENKYNNAFWNGEQMIYGDGDGVVFNRFTIALDVSAHEQIHGLTQDMAGTAITGKAEGIDYEDEAGGINEAFSDIGGIMVKQKSMNQTANKADWIIGEGLIKKNAKGLRSMIAPGTAFHNHSALGDDTQVASYPAYLESLALIKAQDHTKSVDPHDSSGVVNKAFATISLELGGHSWEKAGQIFFSSIPHIRHDETFAGLAQITLDQTKRLYGEGAEYAAVVKGWRAVEVLR